MSDQFFMIYVIETLFEAEVCSRGKWVSWEQSIEVQKYFWNHLYL